MKRLLIILLLTALVSSCDQLNRPRAGDPSNETIYVSATGDKVKRVLHGAYIVEDKEGNIKAITAR